MHISKYYRTIIKQSGSELSLETYKEVLLKKNEEFQNLLNNIQTKINNAQG